MYSYYQQAVHWLKNIDFETVRWFVEVGGFVLAVIALVIAVKHLNEIKIAIEENRTTHAGVTHVLESVSTQYVGTFPMFMPRINSLLQSATTEIIILCDFPGYGALSAASEALEYRHIIENKIQNGILVELTCFNEDLRKRYVDEQFPATAYAKWVTDAKNKRRLSRA